MLTPPVSGLHAVHGRFFLNAAQLISFAKCFIIIQQGRPGRWADCAFKNEADAKAYVDALNGDKAKAVARCRELIALREGEEGIKFLDEAGRIAFGILPVDCK